MKPTFAIRQMAIEDVAEVAALQALAFPPPFPVELLWQAEHLARHLELFSAGQFVAEAEGEIVGSCSNTLISEEGWQGHESWVTTVGGPLLETFDLGGSTLYGLDITVHPDYRRLGVGRELYSGRFLLSDELDLKRYGTACRLPDFQHHQVAFPTPREYAEAVVKGSVTDRTLTPLLRYGLVFLDVIEDYMEDAESGNAAALLERTR